MQVSASAANDNDDDAGYSSAKGVFLLPPRACGGTAFAASPTAASNSG